MLIEPIDAHAVMIHISKDAYIKIDEYEDLVVVIGNNLPIEEEYTRNAGKDILLELKKPKKENP